MRMMTVWTTSMLLAWMMNEMTRMMMPRWLMARMFPVNLTSHGEDGNSQKKNQGK